MGSIEEEDLKSSLDFEFYDFGGHKEENVTFNKVYNKPPPGRQHHHRSISVPNNKVCYENSTYNGTDIKNNDYQPKECNGLDELESNRCPNDSVLLMNGARKVEDRHFYNKKTTGNEEEDDFRRRNGLFVSLEQEENDLQSGLDVSISDDTEDEEEDGAIYKNNDDLLVDEMTDDEDEEDIEKKKERSLGEDAAEEEVNNSGPDYKRKKNYVGLKRRNMVSRSNNNLHGIVVPNLHNIHHGNASCSSGESSSSSSENDDSDDSDLSSLDDDDDEECYCSDDGLKSTDEEEDNNTNKSLGDGPTAPRRILRKNGLSFEERCSVKHKSKRNNNHPISSSSPEKGDMNCNNIDEDSSCSSSSSASEMTDVSPLASSAENSPTMSRKSKPSPRNITTTTSDTIITVCSGKINPSTTTLNGKKNGFSCNKKTSDMDMNLIMQAVEEISKEDDDKWKRRCSSSKISSSSSSSSPIRKRNNNNRTNMTYTNERAKQIEKENERLLSQLLKLSSSASSKSFNKVGNRKLPLKSKVSHSAINRQREQRRIDKENEAFLRRLQSAKPSNGLSRDDQLEEFNSKHLKCPRTKSTRNNGSPFKRPFTATSSSGRNSIISLATDTNNSIGMSKRNVCHHQSTPTINRPEWVSKW